MFWPWFGHQESAARSVTRGKVAGAHDIGQNRAPFPELCPSSALDLEHNGGACGQSLTQSTQGHGVDGRGVRQRQGQLVQSRVVPDHHEVFNGIWHFGDDVEQTCRRGQVQVIAGLQHRKVAYMIPAFGELQPGLARTQRTGAEGASRNLAHFDEVPCEPRHVGEP